MPSFDRLGPAHAGTLFTLLLVVGAACGTALPVTAHAPPTATFDADEYRDHQGDIVTATIELADTAQAVVTFGGPAVNYRAEAVVTDTDGDGRITVRFNTFLAGTDRTPFITAGNDTAKTTVNGDLLTLLDAGKYELTVRPLGVGRATDRAIVVLNPRSLGPLTMYVGPTGSIERATPSAVRNAIATGSVINWNSLRVNDTLLFRLSATGLAGAVAAEGDSAAIGFASLVGSDLRLTVRQTNPAPELAVLAFPLSGPGVSYVPAPAADTYYVIVNTTTIQVRAGNELYEPSRELDSGMEFRLNASVLADSRLTRRTETRVQRFVIANDGEFTIPQGDIIVAGGIQMHLAGTTYLPPYATPTFTMVVGNDIVLQRTLTLTRTTSSVEGYSRTRFETNVTVPTVSKETPFELRVGTEIASTDGTIVKPNATLQVVRLDEVGTNYGVFATAGGWPPGYVVLHDGTIDGPVLDWQRVNEPSTVRLAFTAKPGGERTVVVVVHRNVGPVTGFEPGEDPPYSIHGTPVAETVTVRLGDPPTPTTATVESSTTAMTSTVQRQNITAVEVPSTGFSVGTAVVAVVAFLTLTARLRRPK